ncbi:MAG: universal stress protein [Desulfobacterales bacterium]|nr:universal stress protein [Desulfobacterales bacterium]
MEIKKVLFATNLKEPTYNLFEGLLRIKRIGLEEIILLSHSPSDDLRERLSKHGINLRRVEGLGSLVSRILDSAQREDVSLIVANLKREKGGFFRGSIAKSLIRNTHLPLLIAYEDGKETSRPKKGIFDTVVLATDWSAPAQRALNYIMVLKDIIGVLDMVYVLNEKLTVRDIRELKVRLDHIRKICLGEKIDAESHIYAGKTPEEILLAAKDYKATAIVMGTGSKGTIKEIFSGSASYRVAEKTSLPVLIIP